MFLQYSRSWRIMGITTSALQSRETMSIVIKTMMGKILTLLKKGFISFIQKKRDREKQVSDCDVYTIL